MVARRVSNAVTFLPEVEPVQTIFASCGRERTQLAIRVLKAGVSVAESPWKVAIRLVLVGAMTIFFHSAKSFMLPLTVSELPTW